EQAEPPRDVVEDGEVLGAEERRLGHGWRRAGREWKLLEVSSGLVAQVTHRATVESRNPRHRRLGRNRPECGQRVAFAKVERPGLIADERIAGEALAAVNTLEQEPGRIRRARDRVGAGGGG